MNKRHAASLVAICFALAACSDSPANRGITAPDARPTLDAATLGGASVVDLATGEPAALTSDVGTERAATGGRASGKADITLGGTDEKYSFIALSTAPFPTAKGQFQGSIRATTSTLDIHADINCLAIVGNQAYVSGPVTKFVVNGEPQPVAFDIFFRVLDNGEGRPSGDMASQLFSTDPQGCRFLFQVPLFPSEDGNIQVQQK